MLTCVEAGPVHLRGISVGGVYTALHVPELGALLDAGACPRSFVGPDRLFLSHGHADHAGALIGLLGLRALVRKPKPLRVHLPAEIEDDLRAVLEAASRLQGHALAVNLVPMRPGDEAPVDSGLTAHAFRTHHPVPSLGYRFVRRIKKLRPAYAKLSGAEIRRRRLEGEDAALFEVRERTELAYATDTLVGVLDREPSLYRARVLILECTFLDERKPPAVARAGCHIHLDELLERGDRFENEALVLMHFSQTYEPAEVHEILARRCPPRLRERLVVFAPQSGDWPG
jgi:ribonuclease Z